jgi:hypothetical protein
MSRLPLLLLALLVLLGGCFAVSGAEAVNFVEKTNHFLFEGEYAEIYPVVRISHNGQKYWVVSVLSGGSITGFIPVEDSKEMRLPEGKLARKRLVKTAHYLRLYDKLKGDFSRQGAWVLKNTDIDFFNALANELKSERVDLTTIGSELGGYSSLQIMVAGLREQLDSLRSLAEETAAKMGEFKGLESDFFSKPDTNSLDDFVGALDAVFRSVESFDSARAAYLADLDELKQGIAQTELGVESKRSLNALASVPLKMIEASSRITNALNLQEKTDEAYSTAMNQSDDFVQNLAVREKRSTAWLAIYGFDNDIIEAVKLQGVNSLQSLVELILDESYLYQWREQNTVSMLQESWSKTTAYFDNGSFDSAKQFAEKSKKQALKIFKGGFAEPEKPINTDLLISGVVLLIVVLFILYAVRNREKLSSLIIQPESEEEVPIHEWEK